MGFLKKLFGGPSLDAETLLQSGERADTALLHLLALFAPARPLPSPGERQRWSRVLPQPFDEAIKLLEKQGWLAAAGDSRQVTEAGAAIVTRFRARLEAERLAVLPRVRKALQERDTSEALDIRRAYEATFPLGEAGWTGPEPQMSHSGLTRRILFMTHWLVEGLSPQTADWLRMVAAEQHLWGISWRLPEQEIPDYVRQELSLPGVEPAEAVYWRANQLMLYVENHDTWQRCKGGDHVRRIEITGPNDEYTCDVCRAVLGKEFLVARVPELPHRGCTSLRGCRCKYEPVLETIAEKP